MYQYSRAIYRSIKDLIDPYVSRGDQLYLSCVLKLADDLHWWYMRGHHIMLDGFSGAMLNQRATLTFEIKTQASLRCLGV